MAWDMNKITIIGRLTRDVEMRYTAAGVPVAKLSIAVGGYKENEVSFFGVVVWGKPAENCNAYIGKGSQIAIDGHLQQNRWETQDGSKRSKVEIVADRVQFLSKPKNDEQPGKCDTPPPQSDFEPEFDDARAPF